MAAADTFVTNTRTDVVQILELIERAQAIAAARVQETVALGGVDIINDFDWDAVEMTKQEFSQALVALQDSFPSLLGDDAAKLYPFKVKLA